jgi:hypothetical protein
MPEQPDNYDLTETDMDMIAEELTGKPVKPDNLAAGIASMRQRIVQLESEKAKTLDQLDTVTGKLEANLNADLAKLNTNLAMARERLTHYEAQSGGQN